MTISTSIESVRGQFRALSDSLALFDGPGGTQCPDSVIDAIGEYLATANANKGGSFSTSKRTDRVIASAREAAGSLLGVEADEPIFGPNMTTLSFALSRTAAREWTQGDEIVVTELDHDANVAPWLQLARDRGFEVKTARIDDNCRLDLDHLESLLSDRTRVVAFPWASNVVGTVVPVAQVAELARSVGALAWCDAVQYAPHGRIDVTTSGVDVLFCSAYKFYGPHLGVAWARRDLLSSWSPYKVRPAPDQPLSARFETGTAAHELLAGFTACVEYVNSVGWDFIEDRERELGQRFLDGLPAHCSLFGRNETDGRVPTFAFSVAGWNSGAVAEQLGNDGIAIWSGHHYAFELAGRLGREDGTVRVGIVHYNTNAEVDRLIAALDRLS